MRYWVLLGVIPHEFCEPLAIYHDEVVADRYLEYINGLSDQNKRKFGKLNFDIEYDHYELIFVKDKEIQYLPNK